MAKKREHVQDYGPECDPVIDEFFRISELVEYEELSAEELTAIRLRLADLVT